MMFIVTVKPQISGLSGESKMARYWGTRYWGGGAGIVFKKYSNKNGGKNGGTVFGSSVLEDFTVSL